MNRKITAPKNTTIKGQPHQLAYINNAEQGLLMALGGSGKPVNGIPAYYDEGDDYSGPNATDADTGANFGTTAGDDSGADFGGNDAENAIAEANRVVSAQLALQDSLSRERAQRAAAGQAMVNTTRNPFANSGLTAADRAFNTVPNAQRVAQSYFNNPSVFAPSVYSSRTVGQNLGNLLKGLNLGGTSLYSNYFDDPTFRGEFSNMAVNQLNDRVAGYNSATGPFGRIVGFANAYGANNIIKALENGGRPVLDAQGNVKGAFTKGPLGFEVYTGSPVEGVDGTGFGNQGGNDRAEIKEPNPLTGQCDAGYVFDEDLNACRLDTGSGDSAEDAIAAPDGLYFQRSILDDAPQFMPAGMDFDEMNKNFRRAAAYNPQNFENQMDTTGFSLLT